MHFSASSVVLLSQIQPATGEICSPTALTYSNRPKGLKTQAKLSSLLLSWVYKKGLSKKNAQLRAASGNWEKSMETVIMRGNKLLQ